MGNVAERIRQKKARLKGYYSSDPTNYPYKYGGECWHAFMDGFRDNHDNDKKDCEKTKAPAQEERK